MIDFKPFWAFDNIEWLEANKPTDNDHHGLSQTITYVLMTN